MANKLLREIVLDGERISYTLEYKNIKNVNIHCTPEKGLYISAPFHADLQKIDNYLSEHSADILTAYRKAKKASRGKARTERRRITLCGRSVEYELNFKDIKKLRITVTMTNGVRVYVPLKMKISDVESFLKRNEKFVIGTIDKCDIISESMPKVKTYSDGEYIYYLGKRCNIRVSRSSRNYADISGNELHIYVTDPDDTALKAAVVETFMKQQCARIIPEMCRSLYPRFKAKGIEYPKEIRFRKMVSCWGNCRPQRSVITFSTYLVQLPEKCIEQVICHEFTHFLHQNHSKAFYAQLAEFMPDYKKYDDIMKKLQNEIIIKNR